MVFLIIFLARIKNSPLRICLTARPLLAAKELTPSSSSASLLWSKVYGWRGHSLRRSHSLSFLKTDVLERMSHSCFHSGSASKNCFQTSHVQSCVLLTKSTPFAFSPDPA